MLRKCPKCQEETGREYTIGIIPGRQGQIFTYWMECTQCKYKWQAVQVRKV